MIDFANRLMLEIAIERVAENLTIPAAWRDGCDHFRLALWRPGARETHFQFSVYPADAVEYPDVYDTLQGIACQVAMYEANPTVQAWCAATGARLDDVVDTFDTFAQETRTLQSFFGEYWEEFLSYAAA